MKFVIDLMGGDNGPEVIIEAAKKFALKHENDIFYCVGDSSKFEALKTIKNVILVESTTVLKMDCEPMEALHEKTSSMFIATQTFIDEKCDGIISAGSTGALLTLGTLKIKRLNGVLRPALITPFPTIQKGKNFVCLDLGANVSNTKEELHQFAQMGSLFYKLVYGNNNPRVALLNNGTEEEKGNELTKETYQILKADKDLNFIGNLEGRQALYYDTDVLVTDGFTGNVFLKTTEGSCKAMSLLIKEAFKKNIITKIGYLFAKKGFDEMSKKMDYKSVGGAMLIGINGVLVKAHGNSDVRSFTSALDLCYNLVSKDILTKMKDAIK